MWQSNDQAMAQKESQTLSVSQPHPPKEISGAGEHSALEQDKC